MRWPSILKREAPVETFNFDTQVSAFWAQMTGPTFTPRLIERVGVASRCLHLTANAIARMPLRFSGSFRPAWVSNPDPVWFPNGIGDALYYALRSMYGWGDAFLYVTGFYASGFPSSWTVLDPSQMDVKSSGGRRTYRFGQTELDPGRMVQISRNPGAIRGTSALRAYAGNVAGALRGEQAAATSVPATVLKPQRRVTKEQAAALQAQWVEATRDRGGYPAVVPPDLDFDVIGLSPKDLALLDTREFDARQICAAFGIPSFLLNLPLEGGLTYQNPEMLFEVWWRTELKNAADAVGDALTAQMLPAGNSVQFDARDVLAPGLKDLHSIWFEAEQGGLVTEDEYRLAVLQLGPKSDANAIDELTTPATASITAQTQNGNVAPLRPVEAVLA